MSAHALPAPGRAEAGVALGGFAGLVGAAALGGSTAVVAGLGLLVVVAALHRVVLQWHVLLALTIAVIFLIPIRRYVLPVDLPIDADPYRVLVALILGGWCASLLADERVSLRRSHFDKPIGLFLLAVVASLAMNPGRASSTQPELTKKILFFASFVLVFYLVVSVVRSIDHVELLTKAIVVCGSIVAVAAIYETRSGYNVFDHLSSWIPVLEPNVLVNISESTDNRGATTRAYGSAQHAIALGAVLVMVIPMALALTRTSGKRWWLAVAVLGPGAISSVSRTTVLMLLGAGLVFVWLRFRESRRLAPLAIPMVVLIHLAVPGTLGTLKESFFPDQGLIAQQTNTAVGSGRLATLGPALSEEFAPNPLVGEGFGTRVVTSNALVPKNAPILDDQWLGILVETGVVGTLAWLWLFGRSLRLAGKLARRRRDTQSWLLTGLAASTGAYAVGMFVYDAFTFVQVTFLLFLVLGLAASTIAVRPAGARRPPRPAA